MKSFKYYPQCGLILCSLLFGICQSAPEEPKLPPTEIIPVKPPSPNLHPVETSTQKADSDTEKPIITDTPAPPTKLTEPPTSATTQTTTPIPTTDITTPTTTDKTTPTTTIKPTTTTTAKPTTTPPPNPPPTPKPTPPPAPTPLPPASQGTWNHTEKNITCIMVQFAGRLNVSYHMNNSATVAHTLLNIPAEADVVNGSCTPPQIVISWPSVGSVVNNSVTLQWSLNATTEQYRLSALDVLLVRDQEHFPNSSDATPLNLRLTAAGGLWETPLSTSYRCESPRSLALSDVAGEVATLDLDRLREEAYHNTTDTHFSAARSCLGPDLPDVVPIVVGCVLAGLVLVVLVAYLVARRRSTRGYLSM